MSDEVLRCRLCREPMQYVHGHAACLTSGCPLFGQNQAECCDGEQVADDWVPASDAAAPAPHADGESAVTPRIPRATRRNDTG